MRYDINHSRYIGSRRLQLSANEQKLIARAEGRAKAKPAVTRKKRRKSPEKLAEQRSRWISQAEAIVSEIEGARGKGDASRVLNLCGQAKGYLLQAYGEAAREMEVYVSIESYHKWARKLVREERRKRRARKLR
jgi:hypothetical protein